MRVRERESGIKSSIDFNRSIDLKIEPEARCEPYSACDEEHSSCEHAHVAGVNQHRHYPVHVQLGEVIPHSVQIGVSGTCAYRDSVGEGGEMGNVEERKEDRMVGRMVRIREENVKEGGEYNTSRVCY